MTRMTDMTGKRVGKLTVHSYSRTVDKVARWNCICDCGETLEVRGAYLRSGHTKSCGCLVKEANRDRLTTHGESKSHPLYRTWCCMVARCTNPKSDAYRDYGARGIGVCERWLSFESFAADMGQRPAGTTLDRKDNDKGYSPENCRWATRIEQARNRRDTVMHMGRPLREWAEELGVDFKTLYARVKVGKPIGEPVQKQLGRNC